jgi:hypothetical protein
MRAVGIGQEGGRVSPVLEILRDPRELAGIGRRRRLQQLRFFKTAVSSET